jgi:HEAT repeat protein
MVPLTYVRKKSGVLLGLLVALTGAARAADQGAVRSEAAWLSVALEQGADANVRSRAFAELRAVASESSVPRLAPLLNDPAWSFAARSVLEVMPGESADAALLQALESVTDASLRAGFINSLGHRRTTGAVPQIAKFLAGEASVARAAANALGDIGSIAAGEALVAHDPGAEMREAWADALLRVAELQRASAPVKAVHWYRAVGSKADAPQRAAAAIGLARLSDDAAAGVAGALKSDLPDMQSAALAVIRSGELGPVLTTAVAQAFATLAPDLQVQVLSALYDRADPAALAVARRALASKQTPVVTAAAKLLSVIGGAAEVPALLGLCVGPDEPGPAARLALARIPGEEITNLLLGQLRGSNVAQRAAALDVLVARGHRPLVSELLRAELYRDAALGRSATNALAVLGRGEDLSRVLELHHHLPAERRSLLEPAVRRLAEKHSAPSEAAAMIVASAGTLPLEEAAPLFITLAGIGGDAALSILSKLAKSPTPEKRMIAVRALGNWRDARAAPTLLSVVREDADAAVRQQAVQSAIAVFRKSVLGPEGGVAAGLVPAAVTGLKQTWEAAQRAEDKNAVVGALKALKDPRAVGAAEELEKRSAPAP